MALDVNATIPFELYHVPVGFVGQPNLRGTIDILWSSLLVIFMCTWTVLHINLPKPGEGCCSILLRKARWAMFCVYAPEAITIIASVQRQSAKRSVTEMKSLGLMNWTVAHGFFADMGGFMLRRPDMDSFPVNNRAIHYLIERKYIEPPTTTIEEIWDRSKADTFAKLVACIQSSWMIVQVIARRCQGLEICPLELVTVAFVLCAAVSWYFWMDKPLGVQVPVDIALMVPMEQVRSEAGDAAKEQWQDTPMDFVEQPGWKEWKRRPWLRNCGGMAERPIRRIPNDFFEPPKTMRLGLFLFVVTSAYATIHVLGWNFPFPTTAEVYIWRICSLILLGVLSAWGVAELFTIKPGMDVNATILGIWAKKATRKTFLRRYIFDVPGTTSAILYYMARAVILAELFVAMRLMPASVYACVNWAAFLPHV